MRGCWGKKGSRRCERQSWTWGHQWPWRVRVGTSITRRLALAGRHSCREVRKEGRNRNWRRGWCLRSVTLPLRSMILRSPLGYSGGRMRERGEKGGHMLWFSLMKVPALERLRGKETRLSLWHQPSAQCPLGRGSPVWASAESGNQVPQTRVGELTQLLSKLLFKRVAWMERVTWKLTLPYVK